MRACTHGGGSRSTCDRCRRDDVHAKHLPLPDGVAQILRALVDEAGDRDGGPHAPGGERQRVQAAVVLDAMEKGEPFFALQGLEHLDESDERWRRLAVAVRLFAGVSIACRLAVQGDVRKAVRVIERLVEVLGVAPSLDA